MRPELELIERIEQYLTGAMSADEIREIEKEIQQDPLLSEAVDIQRVMMQSLERIALKHQVQVVAAQVKQKQILRNWFIGGGLVILLGVLGLFQFRQHTHDLQSPVQNIDTALLTILNEEGKAEWGLADSVLPAQTFLIDASVDTVIESKGGIVLAIPANEFLDEKGNAVSGMLRFTFKEALDPEIIIKAGLSTMSGDRLLETDGMFYVDARQGNSILHINPNKGIYAEVPEAGSKQGMQLFHGKRLPGGGIDWVNPQPLPHDLLSVNIKSLDFYPPGYLSFLSKNGYSIVNKRFRDSVYFSLSMFFRDSYRDILETWDNAVSDNSIDTGKTISPKRPTRICGIDPSKIRTIWSDKFQNTLLSTREFEARLRTIHESHDPRLLDLYVMHLDKNLFEIDEMAARLSSGATRLAFEGFAREHEGRLKKSAPQYDKLRHYYEHQSKIFTQAVNEAASRIRAKEEQEAATMNTLRSGHSIKSAQLESENFNQEFLINLKSAYKQIGKELNLATATTSPRAVTGVMINSTGWSNLDRYVLESTASRTTMDYVDRISGKQAKIEYRPLEVRLNNPQLYDRVLMYLFPDSLNSYQRMNGAQGIYSMNLNMSFHYDLIAIGIKGNQQYLLQLQNVKAQTYSDQTLNAVDSLSISKTLSKLRSSNQAFQMRSELAYAIMDIENERKEKERLKWSQMLDHLRELLFPCLESEEELRAADYGTERDINSDASLPPTSDWGNESK